jgi:3-oxoacyl-[acyl-carrier-protein] synthase-3
MRWRLDGLHLAGTGVARPGAVPGLESVSTAEAARRLGVAPRTSRVQTRAWASDPGHPPRADAVDLAFGAAVDALAAAAVPIASIDLVVLASSTPSRPTASDAHRLATRLGVDGAAWDLRAGGAGGLIAWAQGASALRDGARAVLVVAVERITPWLDPADVAAWMHYADAAAALVLTPGRARLHARAGHAPSVGRPFTVPAGLPPEPGATMRAQRPDAAYLAALAEAWERANADLAAASAPGLDLLLPYAVTPEQVATAAARVPACRVFSTLETDGCTGAASPLLALHRSGPPVGRIGAVAVGGGISWSTLLWEEA